MAWSIELKASKWKVTWKTTFMILYWFLNWKMVCNRDSKADAIQFFLLFVFGFDCCNTTFLLTISFIIIFYAQILKVNLDITKYSIYTKFKYRNLPAAPRSMASCTAGSAHCGGWCSTAVISSPSTGSSSLAPRASERVPVLGVKGIAF